MSVRTAVITCGFRSKRFEMLFDHGEFTQIVCLPLLQTP